MGKKNRGNSIFATLSAEATAEVTVVAPIVELSCNQLSNDAFQEISNQDDEMSEIDKLKAEIQRLNMENSTLTEKLAAYIETAQIDVQTELLSAELEKMRFANNTLQNENDSYLVKISELSFENAKLTSQLQSLSKDNVDIMNSNDLACQNRSIDPTNRSIDVSNRSKFVSYNGVNGYSSWN